MSDLPVSIRNLSKQIAETPTVDDHRRAVLELLAFCNEIFDGITTLCEKENGLSAEGLLRTLFEAVISMVNLAKHPEKLADFIGHGRMTELRLQRKIEVPSLKQRLAHTLAATDAEFQTLWVKFNERPWHGLSTKESFDHAEFGTKVYDRYYRRASAIAHGQPYVTVLQRTLDARPTGRRDMAIRAENMAMLMLTTALGIINIELKINMESDINHVKDVLDAHLSRDMNQIEKSADRST